MAEMYLTPEQVAARLQVHPETVRRQLKAGILRGIRRGRLWRVPESALASVKARTTSTVATQQSVARDLAMLDDLDAFVERMPNGRRGLPPLSDDDIFETIFDRT